jgi:type IV pilus assembly protein PilA
MQHLLKLLNKNSHQGFAVWKILAVIVIIGILSALTFPSLLSSKNKAISSEAKASVASMNRGQQAYFLERKGKFANSVNDLQIGIKMETENYTYSTKATTSSAFTYGIARREYVSVEWFERKPVYSFVGGVFVEQKEHLPSDELMTVAILCKANTPGITPLSEPTYFNGVLSCGAGTKHASR